MTYSAPRRHVSVGAALTAGVVLLGATLVAQERAARDDGDPSDQQVERGRYLVHHVAQCVACHTPRDRQGNLLPDRLLQGAVIPVRSPFPDHDWAMQSAWIAGLENYEETTVVHLLQHGRRPDGHVPRPPMPSYRLSAQDARAVVAYLKSL